MDNLTKQELLDGCFNELEKADIELAAKHSKERAELHRKLDTDAASALSQQQSNINLAVTSSFHGMLKRKELLDLEIKQKQETSELYDRIVANYKPLVSGLNGAQPLTAFS